MRDFDAAGADEQGTGNENVNQTSGLPANIVDTGDPQRNLFLDPSQIAVGLANDGQDVPAASESAFAVCSRSSLNGCDTNRVSTFPQTRSLPPRAPITSSTVACFAPTSCVLVPALLAQPPLRHR